MLGAACLTSLAAMRTGSGLVTAAIPKGLNLTLQTKLSHVVMTMPLPQTRNMTFSFQGADIILKGIHKFSSIAIGPGLSLDPSTVKFIQRLVVECPLPMVVDADALNALKNKTDLLSKAKGPRILTPHTGEMTRLYGMDRATIEANRKDTAKTFARKYNVTLVLKGHHTIVASSDGKTYTNTTGNPGMATAGSGDVLTGMIAALLAQGSDPFEAAKWGVELHGSAGDKAAKEFSKAGMIATDMIRSYEKCPHGKK
jgi:NAD(P)H-hydrate epimerase